MRRDGKDLLDKYSATVQANILARKDGHRKIAADALALLARRPRTVDQLASAMLRTRMPIESALHELESSGQVQRTTPSRGMGRGRGRQPAVWSIVEGADDGPAE